MLQAREVGGRKLAELGTVTFVGAGAGGPLYQLLVGADLYLFVPLGTDGRYLVACAERRWSGSFATLEEAVAACPQDAAGMDRLIGNHSG